MQKEVKDEKTEEEEQSAKSSDQDESSDQEKNEDNDTQAGEDVFERAQNDTIDNRVFVCVGKIKDEKKRNSDYSYWVMTLDKKCSVVSMWDV